MNKKLVCTSILASLLALNVSSAVYAAPASTNTVITGRTEQKNQSGIILPTPIQAPIYHNVTKEITLTGTIIIDGPELVLTVADPGGNLVDPSNITTAKVADKTYTYSVKVDPSIWKDNVNFTLNAKTIYTNGKVAGQTHTSAPEQKQTVHVAYVSGFEYSDFAWGTYDRSQNQYPYTYNLVKVWDDGTKVPETVTGIVSGTGTVSITGEDPTYDGGIVNLETKIPPVNILSFSVGEPTWTYNQVSKKYDLSFNLTKNLSNGGSEDELITMKDITPATDYKYTANDAKSPDYTQDFTFTAPAAPVQVVPTATNISVSNVSYQWTGNNANGGNIQARYTLKYTINGTDYSENLSTNFTKGTGFGDQKLTYTTTFDSQNVTVEYVVPYGEPASTDENTSSGSNGTTTGNTGSTGNQGNGQGNH